VLLSSTIHSSMPTALPHITSPSRGQASHAHELAHSSYRPGMLSNWLANRLNSSDHPIPLVGNIPCSSFCNLILPPLGAHLVRDLLSFRLRPSLLPFVQVGQMLAGMAVLFGALLDLCSVRNPAFPAKGHSQPFALRIQWPTRQGRRVRLT
jgi:hypothetical protein